MKLTRVKRRRGKAQEIIKVSPGASFDEPRGTTVSLMLYVESFETEINPLYWSLSMSAEEARELGAKLLHYAEFRGTAD